MELDHILRDPELSPYVRRWFFDQLTAGLLSPAQARQTARRLDMDLDGPGYALAMLDLPLSPDSGADFFSDPASQVRSRLLAYFMKYSEYEPFLCGPALCVVLIQGGAQLGGTLRQCAETVRTRFEEGGIQDWHLAVGQPFTQLERLPDQWQELSRLWAWRFLRPELHILRPGMADLPAGPGDESALSAADPARTDPAPVEAFLDTGRQEDVPAFAAEYAAGLAGGMDFRPFRHYAVLSVRFAAARAAAAQAMPPERLYERLGPWAEPESQEDVRAAVEAILFAALALRDEAAGADRPGALGRALGYIRRHAAEPDLTLTDAAAHAGVTPSYLSALFRRELGQTFTTCVTERRLELARHLLRTTDLPAGQVARAAGFRDSHYFSALFKKHAGCSPSAYRSQSRRIF